MFFVSNMLTLANLYRTARMLLNKSVGFFTVDVFKSKLCSKGLHLLLSAVILLKLSCGSKLKDSLSNVSARNNLLCAAWSGV